MNNIFPWELLLFIFHFLDKPDQEINFKSPVLCDFISLYLFVLTFAMKLKNDNYKSQLNILVFCDQ